MKTTVLLITLFLSSLWAKNKNINGVPAKDYVLVYDLATSDNFKVQWDASSQTTLYLEEGNVPYLILSGTLEERNTLSVNHTKIQIDDNKHFESKLYLNMGPTEYILESVSPSNEVESSHLVYTWIKSPPTFKVKIDDAGSVVEKSTGFTEKIKKIAFVQFTIDDKPERRLNIRDERKKAKGFRIQFPNDKMIDSWSFVILNGANQITHQIEKKGPPPNFIRIEELVPAFTITGTFRYKVNLLASGHLYEGIENKLEIVRGKSFRESIDDSTFLSLEPKQDFGYLSYKNNSSFDSSSFYLGVDLPVTFYDKYILRGSGYLTLPNVVSSQSFSYARIALGMRFYSDEEQSILKSPYEMRLDILIGYSRYSLYNQAPVREISQAVLIIEPAFVLWNDHHISPSLEYGANSSFNSMKVGASINYFFYVRPWSMKWGVGLAIESLFKHEPSASKFTLFRTLTSFSFLL